MVQLLILPESAVYGLPVTKLTFDDPENVLHLAAYGGLEILNMPIPIKHPVWYAGEGTGTEADPVFHTGKMRITSHFGPFLNAQIGGISVKELIVPADQIGCLGNVVGVCGGDGYGMYQTASIERKVADSSYAVISI